jgi:hypothetical protein
MCEIPNIYGSASFIMPLYQDGGALNFITYNDMRGQDIFFDQEGIDISRIEVSLWQTEENIRFEFDSDWSVLLQIEHDY